MNTCRRPFCPELERVPATRSALPPWDHERQNRRHLDATTNLDECAPSATTRHHAPPNASRGMSTSAFRYIRTNTPRKAYEGPLPRAPSATKRNQAPPSATNAPREGATSTPGTNQPTNGAPTPTKPHEGATPGHQPTNQRRTNADQASRGRSTPAFRQMRSKRNTRLKKDLYPGQRATRTTPHALHTAHKFCSLTVLLSCSLTRLVRDGSPSLHTGLGPFLPRARHSTSKAH